MRLFQLAWTALVCGRFPLRSSTTIIFGRCARLMVQLDKQPARARALLLLTWLP